MIEILSKLKPQDILTIDDERINSNEMIVVSHSTWETNNGQIIIINLKDNYLIGHRFSEHLSLSFCELFDEFSSKTYKIKKQFKQDKIKYSINVGPCKTKDKVIFYEYKGNGFNDVILLKQNIDIEMLRGFSIEKESILI